MTVRGRFRMPDSTLHRRLSNRGTQTLARSHLGRDHTTNSSVLGPRSLCRNVPAIQSGNPYPSGRFGISVRGLFPGCRSYFPTCDGTLASKMR